MRARPGKSRVQFTVKLWDKWLKRRNVDDQTRHLREGIREFRSLLARYEFGKHGGSR